MMTEREKLLAQSEIMLEHAKHIKSKIKVYESEIKAREEEIRSSWFDYGVLDSHVERSRGKLEALVEEKASAEKFGKKLRHMADELLESV